MERAKVKWFNPNQGFGFLEIPDKPDLWFHIGDRRIREYQVSKTGEPEISHLRQPTLGESRTPRREGGQWIVFEPGLSKDLKPKAANWDFAEYYDTMKFHSIRKSGKFEHGDLLEILGAVDMTDYCAPRGQYYNWEDKVATPALQALGFTVLGFYSIDSDSFGPLVRGVKVYNSDGAMILSYG